MFKDISEALRGLWSLVVGLKITGKEFVKPQVTVHYPRAVVDNLATFRGHIELVGTDKEPATPKCITCMMCSTVCPSGCIALSKFPTPKVEEGAPKPKPIKTPKDFTLNYNTCSLCGLCVQNCPVDSLRFSTDVYLAGTTREEFEYDLMARLRAQAAAMPAPAPKPEPQAEPAPAPAAKSKEA